MKRYWYYPGCSTKATAIGLDLAIKAIAKPLGIELIELDDWTCCGSIPYGSLDEPEAICVAARNLALAEKKELDLVTPCASCFLTLHQANLQLKNHPQLKAQVNEALAVANLEYHGNLRTRQFTEVLVNDVTLEVIASKIKQPLSGLKVAPYYGCQLFRPDYGFDDPEWPQSLDRLVASLGAEPVPYPLKNQCCGSSLIISEESLALELIYRLLNSAAESGAQCITTPCPVCQINLDAYQSKVNRRFNTNFRLPILFIPQLIGLALGISSKVLGLGTNIVSPKPVLGHILAVEQEVSSGA